MLNDLILNLIDRGHRLFPTDGRKVPLIRGWQELASYDSHVVEGWRRQWPYCGFGWALPPTIVVTDLDTKHGQNGLADFRRLDGRDPRDIATPTSTSPTGGLHQLWATGGRSFKNIRIPGTAIDVKSKGGFVVVPDMIDGIGNGREWLRAPWETTPLPAPAWLDNALKRQPTLSAAEQPDLPPLEYDEEFAREALARACIRIAYAPCGEQDATRNSQCFFVGLLIGHGVLDEAEAYAALVRAAKAMPAYRDPWRDLDKRVENSLQAGIRQARPTP